MHYSHDRMGTNHRLKMADVATAAAAAAAGVDAAAEVRAPAYTCSAAHTRHDAAVDSGLRTRNVPLMDLWLAGRDAASECWTL
jgi:hypothetical protein